MPDKWAQYAVPADKWAQYAAPAETSVAGAGELGTPQPEAHPAVTMNPAPSLLGTMKANFNAGTQHVPTSGPTSILQNFGAGGGDIIRGASHIFDKQPVRSLDEQYADAEKKMDQFAADPVAGYASAAGQAGTGLLLGAAGGKALSAAIPAVKSITGSARTMAIGDQDAAALQGLKIPAGSNKVQRMQSSVQTARPYLKGANSLEDLQARIPQAKEEIWSPYQETIDKAGNRPVKGPDGPTTIASLEQERLQLSALNRGLKTGDPNALQLAQQKGMNQAELLERERAVTSALDPELSKLGIDPQAIRGSFGAVSRIGNQISGKSTLLEKPQPYGFGKMVDIRLDNPKTWLGKPVEGVRDLIAGRPLFKGSPTDVGISEGFRTAGPKPDLGSFTPPQSQKLLGTSIPGKPYNPPFVKQPIVTPSPAQTPFRLPGTASDGDVQPMLGIRADAHPGVAGDFSRTRVVPSGGELTRMGGTTLPPETKGLTLSAGPQLLRLPSTAGAGEVQPMIGVRSDYPELASPFARERVPANVFNRPETPSNPLFRVGPDGTAIPERLGLPAPKPKAKKKN